MTLKQHLFIFLTVVCTVVYSQTSFKKGEFVTNSNETIKCYIKDIDWKNNPTKFQYRFSESGEKKEENIENIRVFEIFGISKYVRETVGIDRSGATVDKLSKERMPKFNDETLFLKVLIEGDGTLYKYEDNNLIRFFFKTDNNKIEQLVFKEYVTFDNRIKQNNHYQQQIINSLNCDDFLIKKISKVDYNTEELTQLFEEFNNCVDGVSTVNFLNKEKRDLFNIRIKTGIGQSSLSTNHSDFFGEEPDFDSETILRFGAELELMLPFNNNKWSFVTEPSYQSYSSDSRYPDVFGNPDAGGEVTVNYSTFELPLGIRYYFFLNNDSKILVNTFYSLIFTGDSEIKYDSGTVVKIEKSGGQSIGLGYNYKNIGIEFRYEFTREILGRSSWESEFNQISLILGYQIL